MKDDIEGKKPLAKQVVVKHVILLTLWILVGFLGFALGMKWSNLINGNMEKNQVESDPPVTKKLQASKETFTKDAPEWKKCFEMDITIVSKTLQLLKEEYIEQVDTKNLMKGALDGLKKKLESKKLKTDLVKPIPNDLPQSEAVNYLNKTYSIVLANYGSKITESELTYAALKGMMEAMHDPYSAALEPREYKLLNEHMSGGNYGGIGIYMELSKDKSKLTVVEPIEGSPAQKAGLKSGDWILKINGESTKGMDLEVAAQKIRGEVGSLVYITAMSKNSPPKTYKLKRTLIHVNSVESKIKSGNIGYIRIRFFGSETDVEFQAAFDKMKSLGAKALVIDLRNNGGGYISAAIDVCSKMLQSGTLVVSVVNERTGRHEVHKAFGGEQLEIPLVVLVNDLSASASEITAGALKDTHTAILIGEKTFGKGSVQTIHELKDGGALKYTIAKYFTPKGTDINKKGIEPNIKVQMEPDKVGTSEDVQLEKALSHLKSKLNDPECSSKTKR